MWVTKLKMLLLRSVRSWATGMRFSQMNRPWKTIGDNIKNCWIKITVEKWRNNTVRGGWISVRASADIRTVYKTGWNKNFRKTGWNKNKENTRKTGCQLPWKGCTKKEQQILLLAAAGRMLQAQPRCAAALIPYFQQDNGQLLFIIIFQALRWDNCLCLLLPNTLH